MKKLFSAVFTFLCLLVLTVSLFLTLCIPAYAAEETVTFEWEQPSVDLPSLQGWNFYMSDVNGPPWVKFTTVPYVDGAGPWTAPVSITVTGAPGSTIKKYFSATAVNKDNQESTFATGQPAATEVTKEFKIPWSAVSGPYNFMIKVIIK
jgi:hypothetical protein